MTGKRSPVEGKYLVSYSFQAIYFDNKSVQFIELENLKTRRVFEKKAEAVLIRIGVEPNTDFLAGKLDLDEQGYIKINQNCETSVEAVYAIGDVANPIAPTVSSAVGMGATAAKAILNRRLKNEADDF